ncbi:hypothetical protein KC929_03180 [Patescibacteria group bacterium]|nr:hypothetical protein [Patescibacteria group bacterium]
MKKQHIYTLIAVIAFVIVAAVVIGRYRPDDRKTSLERLLSGAEGNHQCYLYEGMVDPQLEAGEDARDYEFVELNVTDDSLVSGIHNILPYAKDSNRASLIGVADGSYVNVIATASAEGETWQEQRVYKVSDNTLYVGYQPVYVPRYQDENSGAYLYEDINQLAFDTDRFFLSAIDCQDVPEGVR